MPGGRLPGKRGPLMTGYFLWLPSWGPCAQFDICLSVPLCVCHALSGPPRKQLYPALVSQHLWAPTIVSGCVTVYRMHRWAGQSPDGLSLRLCSNCCLCVSFCGCLFPFLQRTQGSILSSSYFVGIIHSVNCVLGVLSFYVFLAKSSQFHEKLFLCS